MKIVFTCDVFLIHAVTFYMLSTLMSLEDRLRLKLKVKTNISLYIMAIMLDHMAIPIYTVRCDNAGHSYKIITHNKTGADEFVRWK